MAIAAVVVSGTATGCSLIIDSNASQCSTSDDCAHFDGTPVCQNGVCVAGIGPPGCPSTRSSQSDYLNGCTTSNFEAYDNCKNLNYGPKTSCQMGVATLPDPSPPMTLVSGSSNAPPDPGVLCTADAPMSNGKFNMIYMYGSSDFGPLMKAAQPALSALATPYRAVFQNATSCQGVQAIFAPSTDFAMKDPIPPAGGWAFYFDDSGKQVNCRLFTAPSTGMSLTPDIGVSDLYAPTCNPTYVPGTTVQEALGPVVPFVLAVKKGSSQRAISAEAARLVFGNGGRAPAMSGMHDASPWVEYKNFYIRNKNAGSTVLTSRVIGLPKPDMFWGVDRVTTDNLRDSLLAAPDSATSSAIGILSIDFYDSNRDNLSALYLQAIGQMAGFLPDSQSTTRDKMNVRDGHYVLWGYVHLFAQRDGNGAISDAANKMFITLTTPSVDKAMLDGIIGASLTPRCAMQVQRTSEIGDFMGRAKGDTQCGCYFDFKTTGRVSSSSCTACTTAEDCPGKHPCRYGYCELGENP